jgi:hypothetical protein
MVRIFLALFLASSMAGGSLAQSDAQRHSLTVPLLEKFNAATRELEKSVGKADDDEKDNQTVDELVKELDAKPGVKPVLARHGLSTRTYALTAHALFQAGFYLMMEPSMDKKKGAVLLASYPRETQANIELLRRNPKLLK